MTLVGFESFDTANAGTSPPGWVFSGLTYRTTSPAPLFGVGRYIGRGSTGGTAYWSPKGLAALGGSSEVVFGGWFYCSTVGSIGTPLVAFQEDGTGGTVHAMVSNSAGNLISAYRGTTLLGSSTATMSLSAWHYVEVKIKIHDTDGYVIVRVDTVEVLNLQNQDTRVGGTGLIDTFRVCGSATIYIDDCWAATVDATAPNDFLGFRRISTLTAQSAGNSAQFTPLSSTNVSNVDETVDSDGDTSYNASLTIDQLDSFVATDLPFAAANITAVKIVNVARKTDAGPSAIKSVLRTGGVDYLGSELQVTPSYDTFEELMLTNPDTGVAFTDTVVNGMEIGYKKTA